MDVVSNAHERELKLKLRLAQIEKNEFSQNDFIGFVRTVWPDFIAGRHHKIIAEKLERVARGELKRLIINMAPRHRLALDTRIPTTKGWKTISEIVAGDYVFSPSGEAVLVTGKSEVYEEDLYRVTSIDGHTVDCDGEHLWTVRLGRKTKKFQTYSTAQLYGRQNGDHLVTLRGGGTAVRGRTNLKDFRPPRLPVNHAVVLPEADLPIPPYLLGLWLGDGTRHCGIITARPDDELVYRSMIEALGYRTTDQSTPYTFGVLGLKVRLRELGVLNNKHIPDEYLFGSIAQRRALVQGLMDSDGNVSKAGQCFFSQKDPKLTAQFRSLLNSLGVKNTLQVSEAKIGDVSYGPTHRVSFYMKDCALLSRKALRTREPMPCNVPRSIRIEALGRKGLVQCLQVANEDGLFLMGEGWLTGHNTKSEFASYLFPAWMMGRNPKMKIIQATHTTELAVNFGRKTKNLIDSDEYKAIFPEVKLAADSKASGRWDTSKGGMYYAVGVGSNLAGRGGDLVVIDDPHSEQTAMSANGFEDAWEWYTGGPRQRLQPGGSIVLVQCMTGDTAVTMADSAWSHRKLSDIRVGDRVATYDGGVLSSARVNNWRSSGLDKVLAIQTQSGKIIRANERHPFMVEDAGGRRWVRLKDLKEGMSLVSLRGATDHGEQKQTRGTAYATPVKPAPTIIERTQAGRNTAPDTTASGRVFSVATRGVIALRRLRVFVESVTSRHFRHVSQLFASPETNISSTGTVSRWRSLSAWCVNARGAVISAVVPRVMTPLPDTGLRSYASITATTAARSEGFFATPATSCLGTPTAISKYLVGQLDTSEFTTDRIVKIVPDGVEEVFDVEIDRTENFIADGVVSHNTRWSEKDMTGQLLRAMAKDPLADQWEIVELPAIFDDGTPCWPEYWSLEDLLAVKASIPPSKWNAQYQQNPTGEENAIIPREWWKKWDKQKVPNLEYVIQSYDTAFSKRETADFSAITTWGVFYPYESGQPGLILLDSKKGRWDFPELKQVALENYTFWDPDTVIIEAKASGLPLTQELRNMGIPVVNYTPSRGNDKVSRVHSVSPLFEAGMVWAPDEVFADELIEEVAAFPNGEYDDLVDSMTQALMRYRQGNFVQLPTDSWEKEEVSDRVRVYY